MLCFKKNKPKLHEQVNKIQTYSLKIVQKILNQ